MHEASLVQGLLDMALKAVEKHNAAHPDNRALRIQEITCELGLIACVLGIGWLAAPHVLDWATHTWYTVVRDRDLSASSAVSESASSGTQSTAASEPAASSVPEKEPEPEVKDTDIVTGLWAEVDVTTLTDEAAIRSAARQLKAQGMTYAILTLKDTAGQVYYASQTAVGAANAAPTQVELTSVASIFKEEGLGPGVTLPVPGPTTLWPSGIRGRSTSGWTTRLPPEATPG